MVALAAVSKILKCSMSVSFLQMGQDHIRSETAINGALKLEALSLTCCLKFGLDVIFLISNKDDK